MVKHINYKGDKLPIRFSYRAMKGFKEQHGVSFTLLSDKLLSGELDIDVYETLLFGCLESGHKAEAKEFRIKREEMVDILDECYMEFLGIIPEFFPKEELQKGEEVKPGELKKE